MTNYFGTLTGYYKYEGLDSTIPSYITHSIPDDKIITKSFNSTGQLVAIFHIPSFFIHNQNQPAIVLHRPFLINSKKVIEYRWYLNSIQYPTIMSWLEANKFIDENQKALLILKYS